MTNTDKNLGPFTRTRQQGPRFTIDRAPRTRSKTDPTAASSSFIHTRLQGRTSCTAYEIGPVSVRFGNTTLVLTDRLAALALVVVFLYFTETADTLGAPPPQPRSGANTPRGFAAALIEMTGPQAHSAATAGRGHDGRPEVSITVGAVRLTACDREAARAIATAAADAYAIACTTHTGLKPMQHWIDRHKNRRVVPAPTR